MAALKDYVMATPAAASSDFRARGASWPYPAKIVFARSRSPKTHATSVDRGRRIRSSVDRIDPTSGQVNGTLIGSRRHLPISRRAWTVVQKIF
jgi:hypothetical protein